MNGQADEGMYPLTELKNLNLHSKGIALSASQIFDPDKGGIIDAIVQLSGCTGSFISPGGLILTNHHCSFGAVQLASTPEQDYLTNGFLAPSKEGEIQAKGITARITESYRDVSADILSAVSDTMDPVLRTKTIERTIKELVAATEQRYQGKRAEVAEMFPGKSYMLFIYSTIKDLRLVYIPPRSIGEFGGEDDNWVWPRHTGDFAFLRAYVAPDGSPAEYSTVNVPYKPKRFLRIDPGGVDEGDAVFVLGYPGRTFRHRTSHYLSYEQDIRLPYVADLYDWQIASMETMGKKGREIALKLDGRIKSLANTTKNYRGKLVGMNRIGLVDRKRDEERHMQDFIDARSDLKTRYGTLLRDIDEVYRGMREIAGLELTLDYIRQSSTLLSIAFTVLDAGRELAKPDIERESAYMTRNLTRTRETTRLNLQNVYLPAEELFLGTMLERAAGLPENQRPAIIDSIRKHSPSSDPFGGYVREALRGSRLTSDSLVSGAIDTGAVNAGMLDDPMIRLAAGLAPAYQELRLLRQRREGRLNSLFARLSEVKQLFLKKKFIPDANSTLRLTYGSVRGYSPADALYASPFTTVRGIIEKTTGREPYDTPAGLTDLYRKKDFGRYRHKRLKDVPVGLLYNLDTTGGNSGSPVLDGDGNLVGVNFDRTYGATINDYAWSEEYSRSIAVDIRYILWVTEKFGGATGVIEELHLPPAP
jgi:hypothetical protein